MTTRRHKQGFTLIELLIAISVMAVMAVLSWRGLDSMVRAQARVHSHSAAAQALQAGLAQWSADLDSAMPVGNHPGIDWDGRVLRVTRSITAPGTNILVVVAWARREIHSEGQWLRWQSPPVRTQAGLHQAWAQAELWAENPGDDLKALQVSIIPLQTWKIFFFRDNAWSNPLSDSDRAYAGATTPPIGLPDGVRLVLTADHDGGLPGPITRDWIRPTLGGKG